MASKFPYVSWNGWPPSAVMSHSWFRWRPTYELYTTRLPSRDQSGPARQVVSSLWISRIVPGWSTGSRQKVPDPHMCPRFEMMISSRPSGLHVGERYWSHTE